MRKISTLLWSEQVVAIEKVYPADAEYTSSIEYRLIKIILDRSRT